MRRKTPAPASRQRPASRGAASAAGARREREQNPVLRLQQQVGNRATGDLLQRSMAAEAGTAPERERVPGAERPAPAAEAAPTPRGLLVEDTVAEPGPEQMTKSAFLAELRPAVCAAAEEGLAGTERSAMGCPWVDLYMRYYEGLSADRIESDLLRMALEAAGAASARDYIPPIVERVYGSVRTWAETGEVTGVPEGVPLGLPGMGLIGAIGGALAGLGAVLFKPRSGGPRSADPRAVRAQLGAGRPLAGAARSRMESAFGSDFSGVRVHADAEAAGLSSRMNARAFTVGEHVAFGQGEYQPGTVVGDALLAHELAHVVQQGGAGAAVSPMSRSGPATEALEGEADLAAAGAVSSTLAGLGGGVIPRLRSGLRLQRCEEKPEKKKEEAPTRQKAAEEQKGAKKQESAAKPKAEAKPDPQLLKDFAAKFPDAADLIRKSPDAMKLVEEAAAASAKFGGYSEEGPGKTDWPYTVGDKVYVPKAHTDKVVVTSDFLFELNNAIHKPKFEVLDTEAKKGTKGKLSAKEYAYKTVEVEVEGMLRLGEVWFEMKKTSGKEDWSKYDADFYLSEYEAFKAGKKTKDDIVKDMLQRTYSGGKYKGKTTEQKYIDDYNMLSGGK